MQIPLNRVMVKKGNGMVYIDGHPVFRAIKTGERIMLQFCDRDRHRSECRGDRMLELDLTELIEHISLSLNGGK